MDLKKLMMLRLPTRSLKMMMRQPPLHVQVLLGRQRNCPASNTSHMRKGYRVDTMVESKEETGEFWRILTVDEDFCELMSTTLDGIAEKKSVKTATLCDNWIVHKKPIQKKVITFLSSFRLPN